MKGLLDIARRNKLAEKNEDSRSRSDLSDIDFKLLTAIKKSGSVGLNRAEMREKTGLTHHQIMHSVLKLRKQGYIKDAGPKDKRKVAA